MFCNDKKYVLKKVILATKNKSFDGESVEVLSNLQLSLFSRETCICQWGIIDEAIVKNMRSSKIIFSKESNE